MLTNIPKVGDRVLVVQKHGKGDRRIDFFPIEKVGRQYLTISIYRPIKFGFDGQNADYEMWESQEAYEASVLKYQLLDAVVRFAIGKANSLNILR